MVHNVALLRQEETFERLRSVEDLTLNQLLNRAMFHVIRRFAAEDAAPIADFDLLFFLDTMAEFFSNRDALRSILDGEDLRFMDSDDRVL
jgi:hypothetical protein